MNAAEIIARRLHAAGCCSAFGIPGGEVLALAAERFTVIAVELPRRAYDGLF